MPGLKFVEIDLVGHEGSNSKGEFCFTLDMTDIATGWTQTRSVKNKEAKMGVRGDQGSHRLLPVPDPWHRFRQRVRVHQKRSFTAGVNKRN